MKHVIFLGDAQYPAVDDKALYVIGKFLAEFPWQPQDELWFLGDGLDFPMLTQKYLRDPKNDYRIQEDIDGWKDVLRAWGDVAQYRHEGANFVFPVRKVYLAGNHDYRLQMYMWHQAPQLSSLRGLRIENLLGLADLGWEYHPYKEMVQVAPDFFATHGEAVSSHAGFTAKRMVDRTGVSGIMGHTHRLGSSLRRVLSPDGGTRLIGWWENGCLCDYTKMDWTRGLEDQHVGFSIGTFLDSGQFAIEQIVIPNGSFVWGGKLYA